MILPMYETRGRPRILRRRGHQPSRERVQTYDFGKFSKKLHEIEKILDCGGGGVCQEQPPRSATGNDTNFKHQSTGGLNECSRNRTAEENGIHQDALSCINTQHPFFPAIDGH